MDQNYAVIDVPTDTVVNIVAWDGLADWSPPENCVAVAFTGVVSIGYTWDGTNFHPPQS